MTLHFGDVNADGQINAKDMILIQNYINGGRLSTPEKFNSDLDCDGSVGESDLELLRSYISGKISLYDIPANSFRKPEQSWLYGRTMYCDGDSIAKGTGTDTFGSAFSSYCHYIGDSYGMDYEDQRGRRNHSRAKSRKTRSLDGKVFWSVCSLCTRITTLFCSTAVSMIYS